MTHYVQQALSANKENLLTFTEFLEVTKIGIDRIVMDKLYHRVKDGKLIYIDNGLLVWFGFGAECLRNKKRSLVRLVDEYNIQCDRLSNDEYAAFLGVGDNAEYYPPVDRSNGKTNTKHILMLPDKFELMLLKLPTSTGQRIAEHYVNMVNIIRLYWQYQAEFYGSKYREEVNKVYNMPHNVTYVIQRSIEQLERNLAVRHQVGCIYFCHEEGDLTKFKIG